MTSTQLHPDLARIAAMYDDIVDRFGRHLITPEQARAAILELIARDDQGVRWRLNPQDGSWYRETQAGWVPAVPPTSGVRTVAPTDVSPSGAHPSRNVLTETVVGAEPVMEPGMTMWRGDTNTHSQVTPNSAGGLSRFESFSPVEFAKANPRAVVIGIVTLMIVAFIFQFTGDDSPSAPPGSGGTELVDPVGEAADGGNITIDETAISDEEPAQVTVNEDGSIDDPAQPGETIPVEYVDPNVEGEPGAVPDQGFDAVPDSIPGDDGLNPDGSQPVPPSENGAGSNDGEVDPNDPSTGDFEHPAADLSQ